MAAAAAENAALDPAVAGIAAAETAEAVAMEEAADHYRHRCLDVGLDQLQWWLEEEAAEWAEECSREMRADHIWQCSREARFGAQGRVWQQWSAITTIWKPEAAAARAAAVNTAGTTEPTVEAVDATAAAAAQEKSTEGTEFSSNTTLGGTAVQAADGEAGGTEEDADWLEVLAAVAMAEKAANNRARAGAVGGEAATMAETAVEAATSTTGESAANTTEVAARATVGAVVWDTVEATSRACAARRPEIEVEEQPEQKLEGVQHMETDAVVEAVGGQGEGANEEEIQAQSKIFDPGILLLS